MALSDYEALVPRLVRDQSSVTSSDDVTRVIGTAVQQYSKDAPREVVEDITWTTAGYFGPVGDEMTVDSTVLQSEVPIGNVPPTLVGMALAVSPSGLGLVSDTAISAGQLVRTTYTADHLLDGTNDTIPLRHRDAVAAYAASLLCRELAAYYSGERESSINADASSTDSRARNYGARSKEFRAAYFAALGVLDPMGNQVGGSGNGQAAQGGAGAVTAWPARDRSWYRNNLGGM